jgi:hypothetical protein
MSATNGQPISNITVATPHQALNIRVSAMYFRSTCSFIADATWLDLLRPDSQFADDMFQLTIYQTKPAPILMVLDTFRMKGLIPKNRISSYLDTDRPPSAGPVDFEIRALGGGDTSTILLKELPPKQPTPPRERILELREEIRRLRSEVSYYRTLTDNVLLRIMPMVHLHSRGLFTAVERAQADIESVSFHNGKS